MGKLVAEGKKLDPGRSCFSLREAVDGGACLLATVKKNTNVLMHVMGYFKKMLSPVEKQELLEVIRGYHDSFLPLIVPITLLSHYVRI